MAGVSGVPAVLSLLAAALLLPMLGVALYNALTAPRLERAGEPADAPPVSVLVPARDEAENLRGMLPLLLRQAYPDYEVLVLDDRSHDDTAAVARALAADDARLRLLPGEPLPAGWLGKNWACHQLARAARGELLLFCDADVFARPDALPRTVALLRRERADAVTAIPRQIFSGWAEAAVIPLVLHLPVLALLPLRLVGRLPSPSLSMANGQWLAFRREAYDAVGGHAAVRGEVVEDVALGRRVKAAGLRLVAAVAPGPLAVHMYTGLSEVREGFRKNLYPLLGGRPPGFAAAMLCALLALVYPWAAALAGERSALLPLALLAALRALGALTFRHGWRSVLLHPAGSLLAPAIALGSFRAHRRGALRWKGRDLPAAADSPPGR